MVFPVQLLLVHSDCSVSRLACYVGIICCMRTLQNPIALCEPAKGQGHASITIPSNAHLCSASMRLQNWMKILLYGTDGIGTPFKLGNSSVISLSDPPNANFSSALEGCSSLLFF